MHLIWLEVRIVTRGGGVADLIAARLQGCGDEVAFIAGRSGVALRYTDLAAQADAWAGRLARAGIHPGRRVAVVVGEPLAFVGVYLSLLARGVTVVPFDPSMPAVEVQRRSALLHADALVTDRPDLEVECAVWLVNGARVYQVSAGRNAPETGPLEAPAVLLTSSGTTGPPKVVPLSMAQLLHVGRAVAHHHRLTSDDRGYSPLPLYHVNAQVVGVLSTLVAGSSLVVDDRFHRTGYWDLLRRFHVTWANAVPAILAILADAESPDARLAAQVRFVRSASAPLPLPVLARFQSRTGISVLETYGMSEAASQITANPLLPSKRRPGSVGLPVEIRLRVRNASRLCGPGEVGEVELCGPGVIDHYLDPGPVERPRPARNQEGWLATGDIGYMDEGGFVFLLARVDEVINRSGEKVYPREIEEVLRSHAGVVDVAVVGRPDRVLGEVPVVYAVGAPEIEPSVLVHELQALCATRLERSKRPARLAVVGSLPKGPTGKVLKRRLDQEESGKILALVS